jgi:hypothetical protein
MMATSKDTGPKHNEHRYLYFTIVHEESLNVNAAIDPKRSNISRTVVRTTWTRVRKPFMWSITRPETKHQKFSRSCEFCTQKLAIQVVSLQKIASLKKRDHNLRIGALIAIPILLLTAIACFATQKYTAVGGFSIFGLLVCFLLAIPNSSAGVEPGYWGEIGFNSAPKQESGPFTGHYIESVESFPDENAPLKGQVEASH